MIKLTSWGGRSARWINPAYIVWISAGDNDGFQPYFTGVSGKASDHPVGAYVLVYPENTASKFDQTPEEIVSLIKKWGNG